MSQCQKPGLGPAILESIEPAQSERLFKQTPFKAAYVLQDQVNLPSGLTYL